MEFIAGFLLGALFVVLFAGVAIMCEGWKADQ
jgi:hypothetical protein